MSDTDKTEALRPDAALNEMLYMALRDAQTLGDKSRVEAAAAVIRAALAQRQQVPPLSDRCDWCCGTGRFADHACRFCGGKAKGSVFTSQQQQSAQPEQQPVAWRYRYSTKGRWNYADGPANDPAVIEEPLYATQPRAVEPLTQRQLAMLKFLYGSGLISGVGFGCKPDGVTAPYWWRHELAEAFPVLRGIGKQEGK